MLYIWPQKIFPKQKFYEKDSVYINYTKQQSNAELNTPHSKEQIKIQAVFYADSETKYSYQNLQRQKKLSFKETIYL